MSEAVSVLDMAIQKRQPRGGKRIVTARKGIQDRGDRTRQRGGGDRAAETGENSRHESTSKNCSRVRVSSQAIDVLHIDPVIVYIYPVHIHVNVCHLSVISFLHHIGKMVKT